MNAIARSAVSLTVVAVSLLGAGLVAQASPPGGGSSSLTDMERLKKDGYTCEIMSLGAWTCSKPGQPTQTCDHLGTCAVLKITVRPRPTQTAPPPPPIKHTSQR